MKTNSPYSTEERRERVRMALVLNDGDVSPTELGRRLGVGRDTIRRDLIYLEENQPEPLSQREIMQSRHLSSLFFENMRDWALERAQSTKARINDNARVGYARVAIEAEARRINVLGIAAPERKDVMQEVTVKVVREDRLPEWEVIEGENGDN